MSGIMVAVAGGTQNVIYGAGLYNTTYGVETSPVDYSASSFSGATSYDFTWIGYYRPSVTGSVTLGLATSYIEYIDSIGQYNWGGGGYSIAYLWFGNTAKSGYNTGNANITANNQTATYTTSMIAGLYYPVRINWVSYLPQQTAVFGGIFYTYYANGTFNFQSGGTTNVTNLIWYNTKTNGF